MQAVLFQFGKMGRVDLFGFYSDGSSSAEFYREVGETGVVPDEAPSDEPVSCLQSGIGQLLRMTCVHLASLQRTIPCTHMVHGLPDRAGTASSATHLLP